MHVVSCRVMSLGAGFTTAVQQYAESADMQHVGAASGMPSSRRYCDCFRQAARRTAQCVVVDSRYEGFACCCVLSVVLQSG
jgi:hypothetical protein